MLDFAGGVVKHRECFLLEQQTSFAVETTATTAHAGNAGKPMRIFFDLRHLSCTHHDVSRNVAVV